MERVRNSTAKPHDFKEGDIVFVHLLLERSKMTNLKHNPQYIGLYVIVQLRGPLLRLRHFYSGRDLKNWVNVALVRRLKDCGRQVLYNRLKAPELD
jgi:hypothetical protein